MDEKDFETLASLAKTKNITHSANQLFVTQSSLSKRISSIEQELGITLILRSRTGVHFTPEGEAVLKHTTEVRKTLKLMRANIEANKGYVCGTINIGISINYAVYKLPALLEKFRKNFPNVTTYVTTGQSRDLYSKMSGGTIDIAIVRGEHPWNGERILLLTEPVCAIFSNESESHKIKDIPFIGRKTDSSFEREISQWMNENNLKTDQYEIYVDDIKTGVEMVKRGLGWGIAPKICLEDFSGYYFPMYFSDGRPFVRSTYIIYPENAETLPQVREFIKTVKEIQEC